jgi:hypothetical protein
MSETSAARWFIFKPKIPTLGKFLRALNWNMLMYFNVDVFYGLLRPFMTIFL